MNILLQHTHIPESLNMTQNLMHLRSCDTFKEGQALLEEARASSTGGSGRLVRQQSLEEISEILQSWLD